jgi:hypothetical protein
MPGIGYGVRLCSLTVGSLSAGVAPITTSKAFNSSGVQVGSTNTGDIPANWVQGQATVTSVIFANDNSVTSIGGYAFNACSALTSITIPDGVTSIGSEAFSYTGLISVTIPSSVTSVAVYAFSSCSNLATVTIETGVTGIGSEAFRYNANLATVLCYVAQSAFTGTNAFTGTASPLTIRARSTDASWTADTGLTFQGNTNVTVIKDL